MSKKAISGELQMFGQSTESIREQYMEGITARLTGLEMVVAGILSDAQELMAMENTELARKQLNIAKLILFEMIEAKRGNESKYIGESV